MSMRVRETRRAAMRYRGEIVVHQETNGRLGIEILGGMRFFTELTRCGTLIEGKKPPGTQVLYSEEELSQGFVLPDIDGDTLLGRQVRLDVSDMQVLRWEFLGPTLASVSTSPKKSDYFTEFAELVRTFPIPEEYRARK